MAQRKGKTPTRRKKHDVSVFPPPDSPAGQHYYYVTQRPWPSLVFVLPMLLVFELGTYLRRGQFHGSSQLVAAYLIDLFVRMLGATGFYFPGLMLVAILLAWHIAAKHPWRFDLYVLAGMLGESLFWTAPLFVFNQVLHTVDLTAATGPQARWIDQVVRSFGAGLYEELVFRLICITGLVMVLIDALKLPRSPAAAIIALSSALLFAAHHHPPLGAAPFDGLDFMFRTAAGLYLAGLFIFRGFGVAAGCHALYNVIVVTLEAIRT